MMILGSSYFYFYFLQNISKKKNLNDALIDLR